MICPPLLEIDVPVAIEIAPLPNASESEFSTTLPPFEVNAAVLLKAMSPLAFRVNAPLLPILPLALMLPAFAVSATEPLTVQAPGKRSPLACVMFRPVKVDPVVPPVRLKLLVTDRLPVPLSVPLFKLSAPMDDAPFSESVPPETESVPAPLVAPETVSEPPVMFSELAALMVSAAMPSEPLPWVTA